ncbi:MAG TPA: hypothetical protein VFG68_15765, partial [Fimbriiglobus sp.]|nr:hypothetical protein [Fimbriiglobus sp.]
MTGGLGNRVRAVGGLLALWVLAGASPATDPPPSEPRALDRPVGPDAPLPTAPPEPTFVETLTDPPSGFTGRSSVVPSVSANIDFVPVEDRWRIGFPEWDRYGRGHPLLDQYPYVLGRLADPYAQNVLKGDYPIIGQHTFLNLTVSSLSVFEARQLPTATTPFESTARPFHEEFFGRPNQFFSNNFLSLSADLFHGDAAFKPIDWRVKLTGVVNFNYLSVEELAVVSPDVLKGLTRGRTWFALQEFFGEVKLADLGAEYDFVSARVGSQPFTSDFRGFVYSDTNLMVRTFGTRRGNREQFNLVWTEQLEKETNSGLNTFHDRNQNVAVANYYVQDFVFPGYTMAASVHVNDDQPSVLYDRNRFLVRPDPAGVFRPHRVQTAYLGLAGDGHIGRYNVSHAFYWVLGRDSLNPIANQAQDVSAQMAAVELSYDRDWARFRTSVFYSSGDGDPNNSHARGFDAILANPNFAGGQFSYFQRQGVQLFGVNLATRTNLIPNLRSSQIQGQANHVNPGLFLVNAGVDFEITPKLRSINNCNFLWFDKTKVLETFAFQPGIDRELGTDLSTGLEYRPLLNNNVILLTGA